MDKINSKAKKALLKVKGGHISVKITSTIKKNQILRHEIMFLDASKKIVPAMKLIFGPKELIKRIIKS